MRGTRTARTIVDELGKKIGFAENKKKEFLDYLKKLNYRYNSGQIPYSSYVESLYLNRNGRTINEWIEYFDDYINNCKKNIKKQEKEIIKKQLATFFISSFILIIILASAFYIRPGFTGFTIQENGNLSETNKT